MEENRINALAEFLKVVPETLRMSSAKHRNLFDVTDKGQRVVGLITDDNEELEVRFDFDPKVFNIVGAVCNCKVAKKGRVCEHICGFAGQLVDEHFSSDRGEHSLDFLDKHFNAPAFFWR